MGQPIEPGPGGHAPLPGGEGGGQGPPEERLGLLHEQVLLGAP